MLEQKETIDREILEQVAAILKIPVEAIQNFDEEGVINIIANTFNEEAAVGNIEHFTKVPAVNRKNG